MARAPARRHSIQVISRAASVLRALEGEPNGLSLGEIAQRVGLARSTVQRIVDALRDEQFIMAASPTGGVRLGPALVRLAAAARVDFDHVTRPVIHDLAEELGETVDLSVLKGHSAVFIDQVSGRHRLRAVSAIGDSFDLHCTANGKALLSVLPESQARTLLKPPLAKLTPKTITNRDALLKEVERVRRSGIAVDNEEHTEGISALGTGFLDPLGRAVALSIPVPTTRFARIRPVLAKHLLEARARILAALNQTGG